MVSYAQLWFTMWLDVWGNMIIGSIALLAFFFFLCYKKKLGVGETALVIFPVLWGLTTDTFLPLWVRGLFILPIGILWGLTIMRIVGLR